MPTVSKNAPKYCLHKPSGRAEVRIPGRVYYCGKHGIPESLAQYGRLVAEMASAPVIPLYAGQSVSLTIVELADAYSVAEGQKYRAN